MMQMITKILKLGGRNHQLMLVIERWCVYDGRIRRKSSIMGSFLRNSQLIFNNCSSQFDHFEGKKKHLELVKQILILFHEDNTSLHVFFLVSTIQNFYNLARKFFTHSLHQILHLWIAIYSNCHWILSIKMCQFSGTLQKAFQTVIGWEMFWEFYIMKL